MLHGTDLELALTIKEGRRPFSKIVICDEWLNMSHLIEALEIFIFRLNELKNGTIEHFYFPLSWGEGDNARGDAWERPMNVKFCKGSKVIFQDKHYDGPIQDCELEASGYWNIPENQMRQIIEDLKEYNGYFFTEDESYGLPDR